MCVCVLRGQRGTTRLSASVCGGCPRRKFGRLRLLCCWKPSFVVKEEGRRRFTSVYLFLLHAWYDISAHANNRRRIGVAHHQCPISRGLTRSDNGSSVSTVYVQVVSYYNNRRLAGKMMSNVGHIPSKEEPFTGCWKPLVVENVSHNIRQIQHKYDQSCLIAWACHFLTESLEG